MNPVSHLSSHSAAEVAAAREARGEDPALREACNGVEGMFLSILLKQGLQTDDPDEDVGFNGSLREFAIEQTANEIGESGGCGIADLLYETIRNGSGGPAPLQKGLPHAE